MNAYYDNVQRYDKNRFTDIPLATVHDRIWYWPTRKTAEQFAVVFDLPPDFIVACDEGWSIRMQIDGPLVQTKKGRTP